MKLTRRLFLLSLVALAPAVAIQSYNEVVNRRAREAEVRDLALRSAQLASSEIERVLEGARNLLTAVGSAPVVQSLNPATCIPYIARLQKEVPQYASLGAIDREGRLVCRQDFPNSSVTNVADRPYFQEALRTGGFVVGDYTLSRVTNKALLPVALPLRDANGAVVGIVAASIDLTWLTDRLRERGVPTGGSITVADRDGIIVAREPQPERFVGTRIPDPFLKLVHAPEPGSIDITSQDGTKRVLGYVPVGAAPAGLYVSAGLSTEASFGFIERSTRQGLVIIFGGSLIALLAAWMVGRVFIERPIRRLVATAEAWRGGRLDARTGLTPRDGDLGALGAEFDRVADELLRREGALRESEGRFRELADSAPVLIWMAGPDRARVYFNEPWLAFTGLPMESQLGEGWLAGIHPDDLPVIDECAAAFAAREPFTTEFRLRRHDGEWRWLLDSGVPRLSAAGEFRGYVGSCIDITERKQAEDRQRLLMNELNHRVKNTLATVQSIAAQTQRASDGLADFGPAFESRLLALSKTHDLLTEEAWEGASFSRLIAHEFAPYAKAGDRSRLHLRGEDLQLPPRHALALGMAIHELATNAAKYGALATPSGRLTIAWEVERNEHGGRRLAIRWQEEGGPPVDPPHRRGFGSRLIQASIRTELQGEYEPHYDRAGFHARISVPLDAEAEPAPALRVA